VKYAQTLQMGDKAYVWQGDVRRTEKVTKIDGRYIVCSGRFGRRTGKGIDSPFLKLASGAGETEVDG
jgi:hypothetical protein